MKRLSFFTTLLTITIIFISCGGVIGNIEKYSFTNIDLDSLRGALNNVYIKYPELIKNDSTKYGINNNKNFYYVLNMGDKKIVFLCNIIVYPSPYEKNIELSLTSATVWGQIMRLAPEMGFFEKRKFRKLFEENILPKIKRELKRE